MKISENFDLPRKAAISGIPEMLFLSPMEISGNANRNHWSNGMSALCDITE